MRDTGFVYTPEEAAKAQDMLDEFAKYLLELPEVCVVTQKELDDPNWKPSFEAGLIVHHMVYHGDENSPHIHMTYIPYTTNSSKGPNPECICTDLQRFGLSDYHEAGGD